MSCFLDVRKVRKNREILGVQKRIIITTAIALLSLAAFAQRPSAYNFAGNRYPQVNPTMKAVDTMRDNGVKVEFNSYPGAHEWPVWRYSLYEFAQKIFK